MKEKKKGQEGMKARKDTTMPRRSDRLGVPEVGPAQRTRASKKCAEVEEDDDKGEDSIAQCKSQKKKQKKGNKPVEKHGQKTSSKRKTKEGTTVRSCPEITNPGGNRSGKKLKPVKFVLEASN